MLCAPCVRLVKVQVATPPALIACALHAPIATALSKNCMVPLPAPGAGLTVAVNVRESPVKSGVDPVVRASAVVVDVTDAFGVTEMLQGGVVALPRLPVSPAGNAM